MKKLRKGTLFLSLARILLPALIVAAITLPARANYITITNVSLASGGKVQFDIAWENSWREHWQESAFENWDAAWVFIKFRRSGEAAYSHGTLSPNKLDHTVAAGATLDVGLTAGRTNAAGASAEGVGVFIYRAEAGNPGANDWKNISLKWLCDLDGASMDEDLDIQVHAIEMVYVPECAFWAGSGNKEWAGGFKNGSLAGPFEVTAEWSAPKQDSPETDARRLADQAGRLWGFSTSGAGTIGPLGELHDDFPTGYSAFYCMKYEITQGQYAAFLNTLSSADADALYHTGTGYRYSLTGEWPDITAGSPYVACNYLSWQRFASCAAWAGLRPMTELEFEKACRGPVTPKAGEFAWGTTQIAATKYTLADAGTATERIATGYNDSGTHGNCIYTSTRPSSPEGPVRVGIFATATSGRVEAGASYWGIMELSGNLWTEVVSVGNEIGRLFQGTHGRGSVSLPDDWPGPDAEGAGCRGGVIYSGTYGATVSDRSNGANVASRFAQYPYDCGSRAVRSVP